MFRSVFPLLLLLVGYTAVADCNEIVNISDFASEKLNGWKNKIFNGQTRYQIVSLDGVDVLKADSSASASGLIKERRIDLQQTPFLNWSWRIEKRLDKINEQQKSGDDYAARIYIVIDGGWTFWNTKAINYVWSGSSGKGKIWPNAFAGNNAMMFAIRTAEDPTATWFKEKRNIREDLKKVYQSDFRYVDAIALMTDTDNAKGKTTAYYSNIFFSAN